MIRQRIVVLVGLPGSGKSTWAARQKAASLSSDAVRQLLADDATDQTIHARVFATLRYLLRHRLAIGRAVTYVDATHLTAAERKPYVDLAAGWGCDVEAVFFDASVEACLERNQGRARIVPEEAIRLMAGRLETPSLAEGFTHIEIIKD